MAGERCKGCGDQVPRRTFACKTCGASSISSHVESLLPCLVLKLLPKSEIPQGTGSQVKILLLLILMATELWAIEPLHLYPDEANPGLVTDLLERALDSGSREIVLHGGVFFFERPLVLRPKHSGLKLSAASGEAVVLSGGRRLHLAWIAGTNGRFHAKVPEDLTEVDTLWINGRRQQLAREPNVSRDTRGQSGRSVDGLTRERIRTWSNPAGGWLHAMHAAHWGSVHDRIVGATDGILKTDGAWGHNRGVSMDLSTRFVENVAEALDVPGEWYFDAATNTLVVIPEERTELNEATAVVVSRTESIIELRGTESAPVRNITIQGLKFTQTSRTFMKTREPLLRSDWMIHRGGVIFITRAEDCTVQDCDFIDFGGNGIFLSGANLRNRVSGCHFKDGGASGVCLVGERTAVRNAFKDFSSPSLTMDALDLTPGPQSDDYPMECTVTECLFENLGTVEKQVAGITIHMARRITVSHCSLHRLPRAAINIGDGCWGGHIIEHCDAYETVLETGDHGAFNSWGRDRWWGLNLQGKPWLDRLSKLDTIEPIILRHSRWQCTMGGISISTMAAVTM